LAVTPKTMVMLAAVVVMLPLSVCAESLVAIELPDEYSSGTSFFVAWGDEDTQFVPVILPDEYGDIDLNVDIDAVWGNRPGEGATAVAIPVELPDEYGHGVSFFVAWGNEEDKNLVPVELPDEYGGGVSFLVAWGDDAGTATFEPVELPDEYGHGVSLFVAWGDNEEVDFIPVELPDEYGGGVSFIVAWGDEGAKQFVPVTLPDEYGEWDG
jgi:hypothetical protein